VQYTKLRELSWIYSSTLEERRAIRMIIFAKIKEITDNIIKILKNKNVYMKRCK